MKLNKYLLAVLSMFLILLVFVSSASAADSNEAQALSIDESTNIITQNDIYTMEESSFSNLTDEIENAGTTLDLTKDYAFNNVTDNNTGILISKDNFVLNGNGHTIDGNNQSRLFSITGNNVTLNDLILINGNYGMCGGMRVVGTLTLNNVTFINNHANEQGGAIGVKDGAILCNNCRFIDNYAESGSSIYSSGEVKLYNSYFTSKIFAKGSQIVLSNAEVYIENTTFANIAASYAPAIYGETSNASIINSKFIDLKANITAGAIRTKEGGKLYIENCEFENITSSRNGGAIFVDVTGAKGSKGNVTIIDTKFRDTYSEFGGAYVQLGGDFVLKNTEFINSHAKYNGGAIYLSYTNTEIDNCTFDSNGVSIIEGYPTYGGAIFSDISTLNIIESKFFNNNMASAGNAIYAYDTSYNIKNSKFENNTNPIYTVFDKTSLLENNVYINDDNVSTNNTFYATIITGEGMQLTLLNNTINVTTLPSKFDLRDWGWVSPIRNQGWMGACWTFGMTGTLESALLKAANITTDFSENNMQNTMLQYSIYGCGGTGEFGANILSTAYLLSWLGAFTQDADTYDEVGKISPVITTLNDIHVQDVMFTPNKEIPNGTQLKLAIIKYGSIDVSFFGQSTFDDVNPYYNPKTHAQYVNESLDANHDVSIIGWDDNYDASNFLITPPGNGAWIVKNSYGTEWGDNGFVYVSYYDKSLINSKDVSNYATSIIIENTEPYNKNYQYSLIWGTVFKSGNQSVSYMNEFEALENDAIAAVGTYFDKEGNNYTVEIYVNGELKLTQAGVSPYFGYHTIKLNEYIPIRKGDVFKAVITSNAAPSLNLTDARPHYTQNLSFISYGETWEDTYDLGYIVCLKVYTVALPIYTEDLVKIYKNDSRFEANIGAANETVIFEINGRNYTRVSDENGTASIAINLNPGNYTIKTTYNNNTVENTITVLPTLIADNLVKYYRNASQFDIALIDGEGKAVVGKNITMNINGVLYTRTTDENGTARLNINLPPGEYILTAIDPLTGLQMSYNITVLPVLNASDITMKYLDGTQFKVNLVDGQGNPYKDQFVTFNINGKFYERLTDGNGQAALNIRLPPGEYIISSSFNGANIANKITIIG